MIIIQSRKQIKSNNIQLRVSINGKQISLDIVPVIQLKQKISQKSLDEGNQPICNFRGLKKTFQFGDVYLGPDSTMQFDIKNKLKYENCMIRSDGQVYLTKIQCVKLTIKSKGVHFFNDNLCKQSIQFIFSQSADQAQIYRNCGVVNANFGYLAIANNGKIETKKLKVSSGTQIFIGENSIVKLNQNKSILNAQNSTINIQFEGKLFSIDQLSILATSIKNKGYISTKNQQNGSVLVNTKQFANFGQLKFPSLVLITKQMTNTKQAQIQVKNGKIIVEKSLNNKGLISVPSITVGFLNNSQFRGQIQNEGYIASKKLLAQAQYCLNLGIICSEQIKISGKNQKNLLKNMGLISTANLQILNMIFLNTQNASIVSNGQLQIFIQGWINNGEIQNKQLAYASVKGHISNAGNFQLNQAYLRANTIDNQNSIKASKYLSLDAQQIFQNSKKAVLNMPTLTILANKVKNLGTIEVNQLNVKANILENQQSGKIKANKVNISTNYMYNEGQAMFKDSNVSSKKLNNEGNLFVNKLNFIGDQIKNKNKLQVNQGEITTKLNYTDTKDAQGIFRNVKMRSKNDDIFYTEGTVRLENVDLYGCFKHFYNKKHVDFQGVQLKVGGLQVRNLNMKNTHITFTTLKQDDNGKITSKGGYNGLHEGERREQLQKKQNQFEIDIKNSALYQKLSIICQEQNQIVVGTTNPYINGWNLLSHPIGVGQFSKRLACQIFQIPGNIFQNNLKSKVFKKVTGVSPQLFDKYYGQQIPNTGQTELTIQTQNLLFGGKLKYNGKSLKLDVKQLDLVIGSVQVPDGIIKVNADQNILLTHSYMKAKGIQLTATNQISLEASKMITTSSDLLMRASRIIINPTIQKKHSQTTSRNGKVTWVNDWQDATRCQILVEGSIIIRAQQYITMISPHIKVKKNMLISSPNTYIQGLFLLKQQTIYVKKKKTFGGSKTNQYGQRGDKPFQAILQAQQIVFDGNAKVNATFKGKKLIDLTEDGLQLFYVIGYSGSFQNRQFSNFCSQGFEGYSHTRQKFLKANVSQLEQIIRDYNLPGQMIFDTIEWGKIKPTVIGNYKQLIHYPKQWFTSWQQSSIGGPLAMAITMIIAYLGANVLGPALVSAAGVAKASMAAMAIKASTSLICSRFIVPLALTGRMDAALKSLFSIDTVIAAATNLTLDSLVNVLAVPLGINLASHSFLDVLKKRFVQLAFNTGVQAIKGQDIGKAFTNGLRGLVTSVMAEVGGNFISNYSGSSGTDYLIHKALHAGLGAVTGLISGGNMQSMFSGAVAGIVSQVVIQALVSHRDIVQAYKTSDNANQQFQLQKLIAKLAGGVAGGLCGNFELAMEVACNAINYNFSAHLAKRLKNITKNDQQYVQSLQKQHQDQINQMLQDDARQVALADLAYIADQSIDILHQQKQENTPQFLQNKKKQHYKLYEEQKQKYPNLTYQLFNQVCPFYIKKTITPQQLELAQNKAFQNFKQKYSNLNLQNYKLVFDRSAGTQTQMDYFVIKSDSQKKIYIGVAGTRSPGVNAKYDINNDINIFYNKKALPQRQKNVQNFIRGYAKFNPNYKIIISGHSLGGHLCENAAAKLTKQYNNLWATSINAFNGWTYFANRKSNDQIIKNDRIKRIRTNDEWLKFRHGIANFHPIYQAAKEGYNKKNN